MLNSTFTFYSLIVCIAYPVCVTGDFIEFNKIDIVFTKTFIARYTSIVAANRLS